MFGGGGAGARLNIGGGSSACGLGPTEESTSSAGVYFNPAMRGDVASWENTPGRKPSEP